MVRTREGDDQRAAGYGAGYAHGAEYRFGTGVTECGPVGIREFADKLADRSGEIMLRAQFIAIVHLLEDGVSDDNGLVAEHVGAEAIECVDIFVAIDVPEARTFRPVDDEGVDDLFG